jgi:hypothetical protein
LHRHRGRDPLLVLRGQVVVPIAHQTAIRLVVLTVVAGLGAGVLGRRIAVDRTGGFGSGVLGFGVSSPARRFNATGGRTPGRDANLGRAEATALSAGRATFDGGDARKMVASGVAALGARPTPLYRSGVSDGSCAAMSARSVILARPAGV